jgi:RNA polymerase sigma factor (sigma-70 family)
MADGQRDSILHHVCSLIAARRTEGLSDRDLLESFLAHQDEDAFAALVRRHGAMVLGVCRRALGHLQDAEDACQAVFLLLARKAATVRKRHALGSWLHGAAFRVASNLRRERARRRDRERTVADVAQPDTAADVTWREVKVALDEECARLPERYRTALVLCYLEGKTREEAARQLGWSLSTLHGRLERGRELLRARLTRRGLTLSAALFGTFLTEQGPAATLTSTFAFKTARTATLLAAGQSLSGVASPQVVALAEGALTAMSMSPWKIVAVTALTVGLLGLGAGVATKSLRPTDQAQAQEKQPNQPAVKDVGRRLPASTWQERVSLRGHTGFVSTTFSPDGKTLATAGQDGVVRFWDTATWRQRGPAARVLLQAGDSIMSVAFAPDGNSALALVTNRMPNVPHIPASALVEINSGKVLATLAGSDPILSPDGKILATGSLGTVRLWDAATGKARLTLDLAGDWRTPTRFLRGKGRGSGDFLAFSPDSKLLATSKLGRVRLWELATGKEALNVPGYLPRFSPGGTLLATAEPDRTVKLWDLATGKERAVLRGHTLPYLDLQFSPDGTLLATVGDFYGYAADADPNAQPKEVAVKRPVEAKLWEVATGKERLTLPGQIIGSDYAFFSPDGRSLAYRRAYPEGGDFLTIWDLDVNRVRFHLSQWDEALFSPDGKVVAAMRIRPGGQLALLDVATGHLMATLSHGRNQIARFQSFSPDGKYLTSFGLTFPEVDPYPAEIKVWQFTDLPLVKQTRGTPPVVKQPEKPDDKGRPLSLAEELQALRISDDNPAEVGRRAVELARKHPRDPVAFEALAFAVERTFLREEAVKAAAMDLLLNDHLQSERLGEVFGNVNYLPHPVAEKLLRTALEKSPHRDVRGLACFRLAESFGYQSELARQIQQLPAMAQQVRQMLGDFYLKQFQTIDPDRSAKESEALFGRVRKEFAEVKSQNETLGVAAWKELLARRRLSIGKVAPEIEGEDIFGRKMKLSDYRGRVVLLQFGTFRGISSHRALVQRLEGKPFVLLGVLTGIGAGDREDLKTLFRTDRVSLRAWWDPGSPTGPINQSWNAHSSPFVLDARGVIRFKDVPPGPALDQAMDLLLKELADAAGKPPRK